ncbi:MAG: MBL fold metallo-hydrolase [Gemmatimonadota bacterium]
MTSDPSDRIEQVGPSAIAVTAENRDPLTLDGTRTWVMGTERVAVVDPGPRDAAHLERIDEAIAGRPVTAICLTHAHADHSASAREAADRWAPLHASAETLRRRGIEGVSLSDGDAIPLGGGPEGDQVLHVLASPGHTRDHLAYLHLPTRDLLTGDLVLGTGSSMVAHPDGSVAAYLLSLARLASLRPARLLPGHGPVVVEAGRKLDEYADHRRDRTAQLRAAIEAGIESVEDLVAAVYGTLPPGLRQAAELSLRAHLQHLEELGYETSSAGQEASSRSGTTDRR